MSLANNGYKRAKSIIITKIINDVPQTPIEYFIIDAFDVFSAISEYEYQTLNESLFITRRNAFILYVSNIENGVIIYKNQFEIYDNTACPIIIPPATTTTTTLPPTTTTTTTLEPVTTTTTTTLPPTTTTTTTLEPVTTTTTTLPPTTTTTTTSSLPPEIALYLDQVFINDPLTNRVDFQYRVLNGTTNDYNIAVRIRNSTVPSGWIQLNPSPSVSYGSGEVTYSGTSSPFGVTNVINQDFEVGFSIDGGVTWDGIVNSFGDLKFNYPA